ncbi:hypothetical protein [Streptomyces sp. TLI_146]|uniref:hypothetical protein n=1 Tax=Streptomyces sp. TLI_146 TaxID=1938858 RepID=UPI00214C17BE|nr:hypothetical protein [Streptomyces sp. TLI_146]
MTGILTHLATIASRRPVLVLVLHADRSPAAHAPRTESRKLVGQLPGTRAAFWYGRPGAEDPEARPGLTDIEGIELPEDATVFLCGPLPFLREVRGQLLRAGVPARRIRFEVSGPDLWLPGAEVVDQFQDRLRRQTDKAARFGDHHATAAPPWRAGPHSA